MCYLELLYIIAGNFLYYYWLCIILSWVIFVSLWVVFILLLVIFMSFLYYYGSGRDGCGFAGFCASLPVYFAGLYCLPDIYLSSNVASICSHPPDQRRTVSNPARHYFSAISPANQRKRRKCN